MSLRGQRRYGRASGKHAVRKLNAWDFKGIIVQRARANYDLYPPSFKSWVDVSDLINDGIVWLQPVLLKYDPRRGAPSTFVYKAIDNFYKGYLTLLNTQKRMAQLVSIDDAENPVHIAVNPGRKLEDILDAARLVTMMHSRASLDLIRFLDANFFSHTTTRVVTNSDRFNRCRREFRQLAKETGVTIEQYRLAIELEASRRQNER